MTQRPAHLVVARHALEQLPLPRSVGAAGVLGYAAAGVLAGVAPRLLREAGCDDVGQALVVVGPAILTIARGGGLRNSGRAGVCLSVGRGAFVSWEHGAPLSVECDPFLSPRPAAWRTARPGRTRRRSAWAAASALPPALPARWQRPSPSPRRLPPEACRGVSILDCLTRTGVT
jgi:hypothetical protein